MIIHRGTLTLDKLKELALEHGISEGDDHTYNPAKNHDAISIIKQPDGNWTGRAWKFGKVVDVRFAGPQECLLGLLTHNGSDTTR